MRWLWASYQMGAWADGINANLSQAAFAEKMIELIGMAAHDWMLEARNEGGMRPVGIILASNFGRGIEPFVQWFPWATPRNKIETTAMFLREVSSRFKIFVCAEESALKFWGAFTSYGLIRRGCKVLDYFSKGEHAMMFYTVGP